MHKCTIDDKTLFVHLLVISVFVKEYPWFYMPPSVHKVLVHGADIVSGAILPVGQLSEEAQESRNKDLIYFRSRN
jgi:hypothetical protein